MSSNASIHQNGPTAGGHVPHPLFPLERGAQTETREIAFISFQRRCSDGRVDNCPEDYGADEIRSWEDVVHRWGCGEYRAIGKDARRRVVARSPAGHDQWVRCDHAKRPFTLRAARFFPVPMRAKPKLPRLRGTSAESIALWALMCADQAEQEAGALVSGTLDNAFLHGCSTAYRRVARRVLRLLAACPLTGGREVTLPDGHAQDDAGKGPTTTQSKPDRKPVEKPRRQRRRGGGPNDHEQ